MRFPRTLLLVTAGPVLLAVAGLLHPGGLSAATAHHWVRLHIALLPVFPLLTLGFVVLLRGRPRAGVAGVATVVAWVAAAVFAAGYTGLDAVAGIGAGTVAGQPGDQAELRRLVLALYAAGDGIGRVGVYALMVAVLAATVALTIWHGPWVLPGTAVLLGASYSFLDSHIFWPRGVLTMLAMAVGFGLWAWAATGRPVDVGSGPPAPTEGRRPPAGADLERDNR